MNCEYKIMQEKEAECQASQQRQAKAQPCIHDLVVKIPSDKKVTAVPLEFEYIPVELLSKEFTKFNNPHKYRIHYLGPRPNNSFALHKKYGSIEYEPSPTAPTCSRDFSKYEVNLRKIVQSNYINEGLRTNHHYKNAIFYRAFEGMNPTLSTKDQMVFDSAFESGNLDCVIKPKPKVFDCFVRIDSNTRGHTQWYYFSIRNGKKGQNITLNICNITKGKTLYEQGMKPYIFSRKQNQDNPNKHSWQQGGQNVTFQQRKLRYELVYESIKISSLYTLSFEYTFEYDDDEVFFAYSIPFTYSQLIAKIRGFPKQFVKWDVLGKTFTGIEIPVLQISDFGNDRQGSDVRDLTSKPQKKNVLITGRVHPGESNSSHMLNGFIDFLLSNCAQAQELRSRVNFFIIPMVNPDGVIMGNSRTSGAGKDLNREFKSVKYELYPEALLIKGLAHRLKKNHGLFMYLDFHGHSRKKNTFFYGPPYTLSETEYYKCRAFPRLIEKINTSFRYYGCSFNLNDEKRKTGRGVMFQQIRIPYTYTIESSIGLFYDFENKLTVDFQEKGWRSMGKDIGKGLSQFIVMEDEYERVMKERIALRAKAKEMRLLQKLNANSGEPQSKQSMTAPDSVEQLGDYLADLESKLPTDPFESLLQEVKEECVKVGDFEQEASSDDHDANEDLEQTKLKQFNNLIVQSVHHNEKIVTDKERRFLEDEFGLEPTSSKDLQIGLKKQVSVELSKKAKKAVASKTERQIPVSAQKNIRSRSLASRSGSKRRQQSNQLLEPNTFRAVVSEVKNEPKRTDKNFVKANKERYSIKAKSLLSSSEMNKYEVINLPDNIKNIRKELTKGRILINNLFQSKVKAKDQHAQVSDRRLNANGQNDSERYLETERLREHSRPQSRSMVYRNSQLSDKQLPRNIAIAPKKFEDLMERRSSTSQINRKNLFTRNGGTRGVSNRKQAIHNFQTLEYQPFINFEVDNMAMTIKTFKKQ